MPKPHLATAGVIVFVLIVDYAAASIVVVPVEKIASQIADAIVPQRDIHESDDRPTDGLTKGFRRQGGEVGQCAQMVPGVAFLTKEYAGDFGQPSGQVLLRDNIDVPLGIRDGPLRPPRPPGNAGVVGFVSSFLHMMCIPR